MFAELRQRDVQHPRPQVLVLAVEADRLTNPHACDRKQSEQQLISRSPQSGPKGSRTVGGAPAEETEGIVPPEEEKPHGPDPGDHR